MLVCCIFDVYHMYLCCTWSMTCVRFYSFKFMWHISERVLFPYVQSKWMESMSDLWSKCIECKRKHIYFFVCWNAGVAEDIKLGWGWTNQRNNDWLWDNNFSEITALRYMTHDGYCLRHSINLSRCLAKQKSSRAAGLCRSVFVTNLTCFHTFILASLYL